MTKFRVHAAGLKVEVHAETPSEAREQFKKLHPGVLVQKIKEVKEGGN